MSGARVFEGRSRAAFWKVLELACRTAHEHEPSGIVLLRACAANAPDGSFTIDGRTRNLRKLVDDLATGIARLREQEAARPAEPPGPAAPEAKRDCPKCFGFGFTTGEIPAGCPDCRHCGGTGRAASPAAPESEEP